MMTLIMPVMTIMIWDSNFYQPFSLFNILILKENSTINNVLFYCTDLKKRKKRTKIEKKAVVLADD